MKYQLSLLSLGLIASLTASAEDKYTLDQAVVSASGFEQSIKDAPATISVITQDDIQKQRPPRDLGELLKDVPGVEIGTNRVGASSINIRGYGEAYTTLMLDGHKQNIDSQLDFRQTSGANFMPPSNMIERIEVIRGPASIVHGSSAMGGVVNVITKRHADTITGSFAVAHGFNEDKHYGDTNTLEGSVYIPVVKDMLTLNVYGRDYRKDRGTLRNKRGLYSGSGTFYKYDNELYGAGLNYTPLEDHDLHFNYFHTVQGGGPNFIRQGSRIDYKEYTKENYAFDYQGDFKSLGKFTFKTLYATAEQTGAKTSGPNGADPVVDKPFYDRKTTNFSAQVNLVTPLTVGERLLNINQGLEYNLDNYKYKNAYWRNESDRYLMVIDPVTKQKVPLWDKNAYMPKAADADLDSESISYFLEGEYFITDTISATVGTRYNKILDASDNFSPRVYLTWNASDAITIKHTHDLT